MSDLEDIPWNLTEEQAKIVNRPRHKYVSRVSQNFVRHALTR